MGTCETAAPSEVLSCQKLEASLQMQSLRSFQPAMPLSYPTKYSLDERILRQHEASGDAGRATFQQPEGALARDFNQFGMDSEPSSYYQRHQSTSDDHFNHLSQPSLEAPVTHFLAQASTDPTLYQHHNQFAPDTTMFRQQSHSSAGASLYRQSHLPAEALPFCHQTQAPEQAAFQPSGPSSYQINPNQPQVDALLYQHQNQLPESALYQRQEAPLFHQSNQSAPEAPLFHQGRPTMDAPLYHHQNQRPAENQIFREPIQPVTEGPMYHQSVSTVEASLYRNQRRDASLYHQSNQPNTEASMYHHANQSSGEAPVFHHQDATMFHHPSQPLPGITQHFLHHGHNGPQQASNFFSQNQTTTDGDFFRYQNQGGDNHYQRQNQTNAAYFNLQNLAAVDAQFHHQQNQAESSFSLHQSRRSVEPPIQNPGSVDASFYPHRSMDLDVQLCPQSHTATESQVFQFQNQVPQEARIHPHNRPSAPVFPYQSQVVPETQIHQQNHTSSLTMVNYQNPVGQDNRSTAAELTLLDYRSQGSQDKQHHQNIKTPDLNIYQYQNQGSQELQQSSTSSVKNSSIHYQKKSRDPAQLYNQNQERHQFKPHQPTFEETKQDHTKISHSEARSSKMPHSVTQLTTRDTRNGAGKGRLVGCKIEPNTSQYDKTRAESCRNKGAKDKIMEHKSPNFNRNTVVSQWHSAEAQRLETNASRISAQQQETSCTINPSNTSFVSDENVLVNASEIQSIENISSLLSTKASVLNSISVHFNNGSVDMATKDPTVGALFVRVLNASDPDFLDEGNPIKTTSPDNCSGSLVGHCPLDPITGEQTPSALDEPSNKLDDVPHFAEDRTLPDSDDSTSFSQCVAGELEEDAQGLVVDEPVHKPTAEFVSANALTTENEFTATNAHLLPRPPDILLTVPVDSESHSSSPTQDPPVHYDDDHPSTPSAQLSQEGSDESSPALGFLFDSPEDVDLPPTPPPTPPLSPPLVTPPCETPPPCTPPLSSGPSSPLSSTPPFSSPLSTSPRSAEGELQTLGLEQWDPSQDQPQKSSVEANSDNPVVTPHDEMCDDDSNSVLVMSPEVSSSPNDKIPCLLTLEADAVNTNVSPCFDNESSQSRSPPIAAGQPVIEKSQIEQILPELCFFPQDDLNFPAQSAALESPVEANLRDESLISTVTSDVHSQYQDNNSVDAISELDHSLVQNEPSQTPNTEEQPNDESSISPVSTLANSDEVSSPAGPGQDFSLQDEAVSLSSEDPIPVDEQQGPSIRVHGFHAPRTHPLKL